MLQSQAVVEAVLITSTTTQTVTGYTTMTFGNITIQYETFTQISGVMNVTFTTYTTTGVTMVPVQVLVTEVYPIIMTTQKVAVTNYVTKIGYEIGYSPSMVEGTVTNHYLTNETVTWFTTSASTSTYPISQTEARTATVTLTSIFDNGQPSISYVLPENLWIVLGMVSGLVALGVLGFRLGHRGGRGPSRISQGGVFCGFCGARIPQEAQFCLNCGRKR